MKHRFSCEIDQVENLLKRMMLWEEQNLEDKALQKFIDDLVECAEIIDQTLEDYRIEATDRDNEIDSLYEQVDDLEYKIRNYEDTIQEFKDAVRKLATC